MATPHLNISYGYVPVVTEGKERPGAGGAEWIMVHVGAPDVAPRLGQGVIDVSPKAERLNA